jgi:hypothetical protein
MYYCAIYMCLAGDGLTVAGAMHHSNPQTAAVSVLPRI